MVRTANANSPSAEIVILPKLEMREHVLSVALILQDPSSGETIREYQAAGNVVTHIPGSVHALSIVNGIVCMVLSPVVTPVVTQLVGAAAEESLARLQPQPGRCRQRQHRRRLRYGGRAKEAGTTCRSDHGEPFARIIFPRTHGEGDHVRILAGCDEPATEFSAPATALSNVPGYADCGPNLK